MTYVKVDDETVDKIIRAGLIESYFTTEEMVENAEMKEESGEKLKPFQQEEILIKSDKEDFSKPSDQETI